MTKTDAELDCTVREACQANDFRCAATTALESCGTDVLSFLIARLRNRNDAEEAFSMFTEDLWKGLPDFGFRCSVRAWLYTLARNAANRQATQPHNRPARNVSLQEQQWLSAAADRARSTTHLHKRTDVKEKVRALRDRLSLEDQTLLILHVDRGMQWRELAMVMHEDGERLQGEALTRETARVRKRFERVKAELRELALAEGLLER